MPPILTFSAWPICSTTTSSSAVIAFFASARDRPALSATASASWVCVIAIQNLLRDQYRAQSKRMDRTARRFYRRFSAVCGQTCRMSDPELTRLRDEIAALDRSLLTALNRRLELVGTIAARKADTGAPAIDAA